MKQKPMLKTRTDPDLEIIEDIQAGSPERFSELVLRYQKRLYNFGIRMCRDLQDAEDLVQETFLNAFKSIKGFRFEASFRNWLYTIAARVCMKKKKNFKTSGAPEIPIEKLAEEFAANAPEDLPDWSTQPLDELLTRELGEQLKEAISSLPEKYRIVLILRDIEGFSTEETAKMLNISISNTKVRLHRARLLTREWLLRYFKDVSR